MTELRCSSRIVNVGENLYIQISRFRQTVVHIYFCVNKQTRVSQDITTQNNAIHIYAI
jgi:hypothetical protein